MPASKPDASYLEFDIDAVFKHAGGPKAVQALLQANGFATPSSGTVWQWSHRKMIAKPYLLTTVYLLLRDGKATFNDLIKKTTPR